MTDRRPDPETLRRIASYYGAPCSYETRTYGNPGDWQARTNTINNRVLDLLTMHGRIRNLKLHLRPIGSLTDEEVRALARIVNYGDLGCRIVRYPHGIVYDPDYSYEKSAVGGLHISTDGTINLEEYAGDGAGIDRPPSNLPAVYSYLQSIHVYVPGLIGAEWVDLREN